ncbi:bifunctional serine/threonine-protein kinase/formylglycine-generating enzyme family protein [Maioricimonas sp. JC845]|uniref:bifunctional serine/threonine-protein kinase/formylglycine-generating enzyme family protein n=1 Tax=Maioricimonas sp. JC845 TaxID=3232138 RepID=UPI0034575353
MPLDFLSPATSPEFLGRLGYYDVISVLGMGAFGIALKAFDRRLHRQVALKVLSPHLAITSPPRKRFLREARSCAAIKHPNVVHIYDVADSPTPFISMELVEGPTLQEHIDESGPLEIPEVVEIAKQLAAGLEAAHAAGLIHRDIKPSNVLIENQTGLRAVLTDFGLARAVDDASMTSSGVLTGTPNYMSPEQARAESLDYRSDLFSLGSLLYVMITGRKPFRASTMVAVLQRVTDDTARPISELTPDCPPWLEDLVTRLHEKSREQRIQTAGEVRTLLEQQGESPVSRVVLQELEELAAAEAVRPSRTLSTGSIIPGAVAALCLVAATLMLFFFSSRPETAGASNGQQHSADNTRLAANAPTADEPAPKAAATGVPPAPHWQHLQPEAPTPATVPFDRKQAEELQQRWAEYLGVPVEFTDQLGITFRLIPPGEFVMGTSDSQIQHRMQHVEHSEFWKACLLSEGPQHRVVLTKPYYLATTEVTQNQFESIMSSNPSMFAASGSRSDEIQGESTLNHPVEHVTWKETQTFLRRLHRRLGITEKQSEEHFYRLPTEAEWEFACRGGTETDFWTGNDEDSLREHENFGNNHGGIMDVASFRPNPFGLYDMSGNVHEYVQDRWDARHHIAVDTPVTIDPAGASSTKLTARVARGGDYWWWHYHSRSSYRIAVEEDERSGYTIGFRLAGDVSAYKSAIRPTTPESPVTDFSQIHGATRDEFGEWLRVLRGQYVPICINLRWGAGEDLFDAVAVDALDAGTWHVHFYNDDRGAGQDFFQMRKTHRLYWRMVFPRPETPPLDCPGLKLWRRAGARFATWNIHRKDLLDAVNKSKLDGWLPMSLDFAESGNVRNSAFVQHLYPGVGNQSLIDLTVDEFRDSVAAFRDRNWRLHVFQMRAGTAEPRLCCVFRENLDAVDWEVSFDLTQQQYEQELSRRRPAGWYPRCTGSYVSDGIAKYVVSWEPLTDLSQLTTGLEGEPDLSSDN